MAGVVVFINGKALRDDIQRVFSRRQPLNSYIPCEFGLGRHRRTSGRRHHYRGIGDRGSGGSVICPRRIPEADWATRDSRIAVMKKV